MSFSGRRTSKEDTMSLKSFDKFCENIILGEPGSQKDVFDERQNIIRSKVMTEAFQLYAVLTFVAFIIYEAGHAYAESVVSVMVVCMAVCYMFWVIRNLCLGTLFGIKYTQTSFTAYFILAEMIVYSFLMFDDFEETVADGKSFFVNDGALTEVFLFSVALAIMLVSSLIIIIAVNRKKKSDEAAEE